MTSWREKLERNEKLKAFMKHVSFRAERTQIAYFQILKSICDFFEIKYSEFDPKSLTQEHYDQFLLKRSKELKRSTLNQSSKLFNLLSNLYNLDIEVQIMKETDKESDYITFTELQEIINKADKEVASVAAFIFCTGLRTVSLRSITKNQLVLNTPHPYIKNVRLKGGRKQDIVIMYPEIVKPLLQWYMQYKSSTLDYYDSSEKVFVSQKGSSSNAYIYFLIRRCGKVIGRKVSPKMLRKGLGVHTKELGLQDEVRRMIMGHRDVQTTINAYSDYSVSDIVREIELKVPNASQGFQNANIESQTPTNIQSATIQGDRCPHCGGLVEKDMLLCPHCWEEIKVVCRNCKRFIQAHWKKCPYCGQNVRKEKKRKYDMAL